MSSTLDKIRGRAYQVAGKIREDAGDTIDSNEMESKGKAQLTEGDAPAALGKVKDKVRDVVDKL